VGSMSDSDTDQRLVSGFWQTVAWRGWHGTTMLAVATASGVPVATLRRRSPDRVQMLCLHNAVTDAAVLAGTVPGQGGLDRDRVFDVLMRRVDVLQPHRPGILRFTRDLPRDPALGLLALAGLPRSMRWMLEAAELATGGVRDLLLAPAVGAVWLATARAWTQDDSVDLGATMAALDRALDRAEQAGRSLGVTQR